LDERRGRKVDFRAGRAAGEDRVVEIDGETDLETVERLEARPLVAITHDDRLLDAHEAFGRGLFLDSRRLQQEHERAGAAIHDRHFRRGKIHVGIVDAQTGDRRQQMLDRGDAYIALDQGCGKTGIANVLATGADLDRLVQIDAAEHDTGVDRGGTQGHVDLFTGVKTDARRANHVLECALSDHLFYMSPGAGAAKRAES